MYYKIQWLYFGITCIAYYLQRSNPSSNTPHPHPRYQKPHKLKSPIENGPVRSVLCIHRLDSGG